MSSGLGNGGRIADLMGRPDVIGRGHVRRIWMSLSSANRRSGGPSAGAGVSVEDLEARRLLAATLSAKGTLVVEGTSSGDVIVISRDPRRTTKILATINGAGVKFNSAPVKRIEMYGDGG